VTIRGGSYALQMYIGTDPIKVGKMPFTVGRVPEGPAIDKDAEPDLGILDPEPHRLSPAHFILFEDHKRIFVRDCNSELGTVVNDRNLGRDFPIDQIALTPGENTIIAGGDGSPYKFLIEV
jgi:pSer/pThr/pTyr-binding forkhead associated (FHA) protein